MKRYVAFLRGMNLGRRRIPNRELCACFTAMGFGQVSAFLASGNVIFHAAEDDSRQVAENIELGLENALGYVVPAFVRTASEVEAIARRRPFARRAGGSPGSRGKLQVALLRSAPSRAARSAIASLATEADWLAIHGRELFWLPRGNMSASALDLVAIERALGPMTLRTKRTIERLVASASWRAPRGQISPRDMAAAGSARPHSIAAKAKTST